MRFGTNPANLESSTINKALLTRIAPNRRVHRSFQAQQRAFIREASDDPRSRQHPSYPVMS